MRSSRRNWDSRIAMQVELAEAAELIRAGCIVLHATEGVWGLACDPFQEQAVTRILALKGRPVDKGLIVIGGSVTQFEPELAGLTAAQRKAVADTWPGPVTWLLPNQRFPRWITGVHATVAARVSGHPQARALCDAAGTVLVSTSANPAGSPPAETQEQALAYFAGEVDGLLPGSVQTPGVPSSIRDLAGHWQRGKG